MFILNLGKASNNEVSLCVSDSIASDWLDLDSFLKNMWLCHVRDSRYPTEEAR